VVDGVDTDKIKAVFRKGVLRVTLPKGPEAQTPEKNCPPVTLHFEPSGLCSVGTMPDRD
jgi:hypothetical protein